MNLASMVSLAVLTVSLTGVYFLNASAVAQAKESQSSAELFQFNPPYFYKSGSLTSYLAGFFFAFFFSLLFFGFGSVVAGALEGLKFGSILTSVLLTSSGAYSYFDLLFILPQILAVLAAASLGQAVINDYHGKGSINEAFGITGKYLGVGLILTIAFYVLTTM